MKHNLSIIDLERNSSLRLEAFELIAKPEYYRYLFKIMRESNISLKLAVNKLLANSQIAESFNTQINEPEIYQKLMKIAINNYDKFEDSEIPIRESDFAIEWEGIKSYFFINERLELSNEDGSYTLSTLLIDEFSDVLLYNTRDGDGWTEYVNLNNGNYGSRVAIAYKEYLAEKVLLEND